MTRTFGVLLLCVAACAALPTQEQKLDPVIIKRSDGLRYQYRDDGEGNLHLVDQWMKSSDVANAARYNPDLQNIYHLFTRQNPSVSQPFLLGSDNLLANSNYSPSRRTVLLIHGWTQSATSDFNTVLVPAFLQGEDVNCIIVDWSVGASIIQGTNGPTNAVNSGLSVARTIDWMRARTGANISDFHLVGFSLGAHQAGVVGRNVQGGRIPYITALDPGANMEDSGHIFSPDVATYTEAIHTNAEIMGHGNPLADSDFYPNGGEFQPGCGIINFICNHSRAFHFFAETLTTTGGWMGTRCSTYLSARLGLCLLPGPLRMGGLRPKTGSGIFHLTTNAEPPFSPA